MLDLLFVFVLFFASFSIGISVIGKVDVVGRYYVAPVIGFGLIAILVTLLYRYGLTVRSCTAVLAVVVTLSALFSFRFVVADIGRATFGPACLLMSTILLAIAPKWAGGNEFYAFQMNPWDQINYFKLSAAFNHFRYVDIKAAAGDWLSSGNMNGFVTYALDMRPGVNIVHAAFYWPLFKTAIEAYYPYMAALQTMMALSLAFVILQIAPHRQIVALLLGATFALGPLFQHTIDLNAWGQTAGMPLAFTTLALTYVCITRPGLSWPLLLSFGITLTGLFFIYPEIISVVAVSAFITAASQYLAARKFRPISYLIMPCIGTLFFASLYFNATLSFLISQNSFAQQSHLDWAAYYDGQILGKDVNYVAWLFGQIKPSFYEYISLPVDFTMGALGMFYLLPDASLDLTLRTYWKIGLASYILISMAFVIATANRRDSGLPLLTGLAGSLIIPIYAFYHGYYWTAGKALGMASPAIFVLVTLPLALSARWFMRLAPAIIVLVHVGFGIARPVAAASASGVAYPSPYPHYAPKSALDWNILSRIDRLASCASINLDIEDPHLDTYVQVALFGEGIPWRSLQPIRPFYDANSQVRQPAGKADCLVTDKVVAAPYRTVFDLRRSH